MRSEGQTSKWIKAVILVAISTVLISTVLLRIKNNIFLLFPAIGISGNLTVAYFLMHDKDMKFPKSFKLKNGVAFIGVYILILSALDSLSIVGIRLSENVESAMIWNAFQILFTSLILLGLLAFSVLRPHPLFKKSAVTAIFFTFSFGALFLFTIYVMNVITGRYSHDIQKIYGIFYELQLSRAGFGSIYLFTKAFFTVITSLVLIFFTLQFLNIKNKSLKKYYSILYYSITIIIISEIILVTILDYIIKINSISFFGITSFLFSLVLVYYIIHFRDMVVELKKLVPKKETRKGKIIIFDEKRTGDAKSEFIKLIRKGYRGLIFSTDIKSNFSSDIERYEDKIAYIRYSSDGYRIKDFVFKSIEDIEVLNIFPVNFNGIVIYSKTIDKVLEYPGERREEITKFYRFLFKTILRGAVLIAPINKDILTDKDIKESENPLWLIKPLIVLRLEEALNAVYSEVEPFRKGDFLAALVDMKNGLPSLELKNGHIDIDLSADIDRETFSYFIRSTAKKLEESSIMSEEKYSSIMKRIFDIYDDDYDATVLVTGGSIYFIGEKNPREKAMKMAACLTQFKGKTTVISRVNPHILRKKYELPRDTVFKWITDLSGSEYAVLPHLESIKREIFTFMEGGGEVLVLDGIEYLLRLHDFEPVIEFLWIVQDQISLTKAVLLVPINPSAFEKKEIETIRREFTFIE